MAGSLKKQQQQRKQEGREGRRELITGVVILLLMIITAFIGYKLYLGVLPNVWDRNYQFSHRLCTET